MLANRLKKVLPSIINAAQSAFIKGQDILDNITLAQELSPNFILSSKIKVFTTKNYLNKAFDSINRAFFAS